eukprot:TRINITY_DN12805_c0_g1_i1.p1 TRINITY_DN12805_c0_g1~~TRINITY_DN12805_c0_g1_i1.p1  ORF type:complete len:586 (+),score=121.94 TRINITY_DN12805_c0_g1_i1:165-1922(+)
MCLGYCGKKADGTATMADLDVYDGCEFFVCDNAGPFPDVPLPTRPTIPKPSATSSPTAGSARFLPPEERKFKPAPRPMPSRGENRSSAATGGDLSTMSVSELKAVIKLGGMTFEDCVEKSDLLARAQEAQSRPKPAAKPQSRGSEEQTLRVGINMPDGTMKKGRVAPSDTIGSLAERLKLPAEASFSLMGTPLDMRHDFSPFAALDFVELDVEGLGLPEGAAPPPKPVRKGGKSKREIESTAAPIFAAIKAGEMLQVQTALDGGQALDAVDDSGAGLLANAARYGHSELVQTLLSRGAPVNAANESELPPLFAAVGAGHQGICTTLLEAKADPCQLYGDFSSSVLHYAVERKQPQILRSLLTSQPACGELVNRGELGSPLVTAASKGCLESVELLLTHKADVCLATAEDGTALSAAFKSNRAEVAELLVSKGAKITGTAVFEALLHGEDALDRVVQAVPDWVNALDSNSGFSALFLASTAGDTPLVKFLCENGATVDMHSSKERLTPLMRASRFGHKGCTRCLLQFHADVNARDVAGDTALHYAGWFEKPKVFKILVEVGGADPEALNNKQEKPKCPDSPECCIA